MRQFSITRAVLVSGAALIAPLGLSGPLWAQSNHASDQQPASGSTDERPGLDDIVVTAQKNARAESIQRVPIAITSISGDMVNANQLTTITDVGRIAPNVQLNQTAFSGFPNFTIRGIGLNGTVRNIDPAVSVIVDGMVHEYLLGTVLDTFDLQGVEILRGPQGILFGRNATGGVVSFTTRRPTNDLRLQGTIRLGNGGRRDISAIISGPIIEDKLLAKLAVARRDSNGLFEDVNGGSFVPAPYNPTGRDNSSQVDQVRENSWIIRPTVVLNPTEKLKVTLLGEYVRERGGGGAAHLSNAVPNLATLFGYTPDDDWDKINHNLIGEHSLNSYRAIAEVNLETAVGVVTSISGYRKIDYASTLDADGTPFTLFHFPKGGFDKSRQISEELRFASTFSDVVNIVFGGYYSDLEMESLELREFHNIFGGRPATGNFTRFQRGRFSQNGTSTAVFLNLDYRPVPEIRLSAGGRYTNDKKNVEIVPLSICGANFTNCPDTPTFRRASWNNFSPRFAAEYQITPDALIYGSWTKGYRSGNFNSRAQSVAATIPADPENVRSIEFGLKTSWFDRRARVNIAAYTSQYKDIQRSVIISGVQTLANAAGARIRGVEVETTLMPIKGLELTGNLGYTDAAFKEFLNFDVNGGGYDPAVDPILAKQLRLERVPKWNGYAAASYHFNIAGFEPEIALRTSYTFRGVVYSDTLNEIREKGVGMVDANIGLETPHWRISLYGRNLANSRNSEQGTRLNFGPGAEGVAFIEYDALPRQYGVELSFTF